MSATAETIPYEASGGPSELRTYGDGEDVRIEHQDGAIVVAWSAEAHAEAFMDTVASLLSKARVQLSPVPFGRLRIPFKAARAAVQLGVRDFDFIAVDFPGGSLTWEAGEPADDELSYPKLGEVSIATSSVDRDWIARLLVSTATPLIQADAPGIIERAEELASDELLSTQ